MCLRRPQNSVKSSLLGPTSHTGAGRRDTLPRDAPLRECRLLGRTAPRHHDDPACSRRRSRVFFGTLERFHTSPALLPRPHRLCKIRSQFFGSKRLWYLSFSTINLQREPVFQGVSLGLAAMCGPQFKPSFRMSGCGYRDYTLQRSTSVTTVTTD